MGGPADQGEDLSTSGSSIVSQWRTETFGAMRWSLAGQFSRQFLTFIFNIILMRILVPEDFGLIRMLLVIAGVAQLLAENGLGAALIRQRNASEALDSTAFWASLGIGIAGTAGVILGAPAIAAFYEEAALIPITYLLSANFLIQCLYTVPLARLSRSMRFGSIAIIELVAVLISGSIAIFVALKGHSVWALAANAVLVPTLMSCGFWMTARWMPRVLFSRAALREMIDFGGPQLGIQFVNYSSRNIDDVLIGRYVGEGALGFYSRAYALMMLPQNNIARVLSRVLFPALSRLQGELGQMRQEYLNILSLAAFVTFPLTAGMVVCARPLVLVLFGAAWEPMIPLLQVLCLVTLPQSIMNLNANLYMAIGRTDLQFRIGLVLRAISIVAVIIGLRWDALGVAIAYALSTYFNFFPITYYACREIKLPYVALLRALMPALFLSAIMGGSVFVFDWWFGELKPFYLLVMQIALGMIVFIGLSQLFRIESYM